MIRFLGLPPSGSSSARPFDDYVASPKGKYEMIQAKIQKKKNTNSDYFPNQLS
jgi:hypothetical protein